MTVSASPAASKNAVARLRGLAARKRLTVEACEVCGAHLASDHPHLLESSNGRILCACEPCAVLFDHRGDGRRFVRIPRSARRLRNFHMSDAEWSSLLLPIDLAFFVSSRAAERVIAYYPSPAGSTESLLSLNAWSDIVRNNPVLEIIQPDVEALLINRTRGRRDHFIAPIDQCHRLTGIIRTHWRGLSGGEEVWREVDRFFESLREHDCQAEANADA